NKLWPQDMKTRADISRWCFWQSSHWGPSIGMVSFEQFFKKRFNMGEPDYAKIKEGEEKFARFAGVLNNHLEGRQWLVGNDMTLADIAVATPIIYAKQTTLPLNKYPHIERWFERLSGVEAWKKNLPKI